MEAYPHRARRTYRNEAAWFPLLEELGPRRLRGALIAAGLTPQVAGGVVWFLDDQRNLERHQTSSSRHRYRRALAELELEAVAGLAQPARARARGAAA